MVCAYSNSPRGWRGQVDAAGQIRNAGLEAAKLRQAALSLLPLDARFLEKSGLGMRMRF